MRSLPRSFRVLLLLATSALRSATPAAGQALPSNQEITDQEIFSATANNLGPAGIVPVQRGYNFSLGSSSQYDSGGGWSSILTPDLAFRFNRYISVDFAAPAYAYFMASINTGTAASPTYTTEPRHFAMGDSTFAGHLDLRREDLSYSFTAAAGIPTGNATYGLSSGQFTYNINNHFDVSVARLSPEIELGLSDTSTLVNQRLTRGRAFTSTGTLAHFQAGTSIDLPLHCSFEADLYEDLPIGAQQVVGSRKGKSGVVGRGNSTNNPGKGNSGSAASQASQASTSTTSSSGLAEDNGIYTSFDIPIRAHVVASGIYGYSLRQQDSTAGFSLTYLLRARATSVQ